MNQLMPFERRDVVRWVLFVLCASWLFGATLHVTNGASRMLLDGSNAYMSYEQRLADCSELRTSQTRYDCTTKLMLGRDRSVFSKILFVVAPPLILVSGLGLVGFAVRTREARERERVARDLFQAQMAAYREKRALEEAEIASGVHKEEMFLDEDGNLVEPPAHLSRWKETPAEQ